MFGFGPANAAWHALTQTHAHRKVFEPKVASFETIPFLISSKASPGATGLERARYLRGNCFSNPKMDRLEEPQRTRRLFVLQG
ncbi:hypothetical protein NC651_012938 [Populus alba x Populus x berolinensis]|nr:hypothetical protein NC651_012938 [Populus alba x Populus x berolinensis]